MRYKDRNISQLFQRIVSLANEHVNDDDLYNYSGDVDYTLTHLRMIIDELDNRLAQKLLEEDDE